MSQDLFESNQGGRENSESESESETPVFHLHVPHSVVEISDSDETLPPEEIETQPPELLFVTSTASEFERISDSDDSLPVDIETQELARVSESYIISSHGGRSVLSSQGGGLFLEPADSLQLTPMTALPSFTLNTETLDLSQKHTESDTGLQTFSADQWIIDCSLQLSPMTQLPIYDTLSDTVEPPQKKLRLNSESETAPEIPGIGTQTVSTGPVSLRSSNIFTGEILVCDEVNEKGVQTFISGEQLIENIFTD